LLDGAEIRGDILRKDQLDLGVVGRDEAAAYLKCAAYLEVRALTPMTGACSRPEEAWAIAFVSPVQSNDNQALAACLQSLFHQTGGRGKSCVVVVCDLAKERIRWG
jgi:hypothetical protein